MMDLTSAKGFPALSLGLAFGAAILVCRISAGMVVFSGPLAPFSSEGTRMVLTPAV